VHAGQSYSSFLLLTGDVNHSAVGMVFELSKAQMKTTMKRSCLYLVMVFLVFSLLHSKVSAQNFEGITNAIKSGNASALAASFQGNVEITIKDAGNSYSKTQAEMVLKNFFATHSPKAFAIVHQGTSPEGSKYFIGNLSTGTGTYRTYVYAKSVGAAMVIQEIRFEEQ
jgi:hypothetical protein